MNIPIPRFDHLVLPRVFLVALMLFMPINTHTGLASTSSGTPPPSQEIPVRAALSFVPNFGQTDPAVAFQARSSGGSLFFTSNQVVIVLPPLAQTAILPSDLAERLSSGTQQKGRPSSASGNQPAVIRLNFEGANPTPEITGLDPLPGFANFFIGSNPAKWHTNLPTYAGLVYRGLYPGIDLRYESTGGTGRQLGVLKGTYSIAPGADASIIQWRYEGAAVQVDGKGDLQIAYPASPVNRSGNPSASSKLDRTALVEQAPISWQESGQNRVPVLTRYNIAADGTIGIVFPNGYDRTRPLILDPTLVYSTYLGDSQEDNGSGIAVDSSGIYIAGLTVSTSFPITGTSFQDTNAGGYDAFVTKFNPTGSALIYSTYLGGSGTDYGLGLAVDAAGNASITGLTDSTDYPFSADAFDQTCGQSVACTSDVYDAFVTRLNSSGSGLLYSSYLGGDDLDIGYSIAVNNSGDAFVAGRTASTNFPTAGTPYQASNGGLADGFVAKLDTEAAGTASLVYSTYLGGSDADRLIGIAIDSSDKAYVVGRAASTNYPMAGTPFQNANAGGIDAVMSELDDDGSQLVYSTYLGGTGDDVGFIIAIDSSNRVYFTGQTKSTDFPTSPGAYDSTCGTDGSCNSSFWDAFVVKLDPAASGAASRVYATYFGGSQDDSGQSIAVDSSGNAYLTGYTDSTDLPILNAFQPTCGWGCGSGFVDAFVTRFNATGSGLSYSTFLGGSSSDYGIAITIDNSDMPYITGDTYSNDFPTVTPYDSSQAGGYDAFVSKIVEDRIYLPLITKN
jgi:hypothetical protein